MDNPKAFGYNKPQGDFDQEVARIDLKKLKPINDVNCKHELLVPDPTDETEDYLAYKCTNENCGRGVLISKHD